MKPYLRVLSLSCLICGLIFLQTGCVSHGKAKEAHFAFGVPMIFSITKDETGIGLTESGKLKAADSSTKVVVGPFTWESHGKDVDVQIEKK